MARERRWTVQFVACGRVAMRNALGLMLASVVAAVAIAGIWYWTSAPRADAAPPQTMAARPAEPLRRPPPNRPPRTTRGHPASAALRSPRQPRRRRARCSKSRPAPIRTRSASAAWSRSTPQADPASASSISSSSISSSRQGSSADLRRRPVAGQHAGGAEGARTMNAPRGCSSRSASTRPITPKSCGRSMRPATPWARTPGRTSI